MKLFSGFSSKKLILCLFIVTIILVLYYYKREKCYLTKSEAIEEINNIRIILNKNSPYYLINKKNVDSSLNSFVKIVNKKNNITKNEFALQIEKVLGCLKDRHSNIEIAKECENNSEKYLPFSIAPLGDNKIIALQKTKNDEFTFYIKKYPYLKKINDIDVNFYINESNYFNKYAPRYSKLYNGVENLYKLHNLDTLFANTTKVKFTFSDFKKDTTLILKYTDRKSKWKDILYKTDNSNENIKYKIDSKNNAYIRIPEMYSKKGNKDVFLELEKIMSKSKESKSLIVDIRNNPGGTRDLINFFSNYFISKNDSFLANIVSVNENIDNETINQLNSRGLYSYNYYKNNPKKVEIINAFVKNFKPVNILKNSTFNQYYYAIIGRNDINNLTYYYDKPIYILINENTFSAASVFASVFKDIKNINLVGICTNGSSGLSKKFTLKKTVIKLSQMISYQKNGNLFDGMGTEPNIKIERSINHIFFKEDNQLHELLNIINHQNK
jgi:C-terminal processing protease CtpA/Prc